MPKEKIINQIAAQHLNIQTLETRKRDCLDFHDVSVWGVKDALEAAYEAGRKSKEEKSKKELAFLGTIEATYRALIKAFGHPKMGDAYKTQAHWLIELAPDCFVEIYNYKNSKSYDSSKPRIERVREWSVNGTDSDAIEWVKGMLGQETK